MTAVHSARLAKGASGQSGVFVTIYTSPPGITTIVKDIRLATLTATADTANLAIAGPEPGQINLFNGQLAAGGSVHSLQPWIVLSPGDRLLLKSAETSNVGYWVSGTKLEGVAPAGTSTLPA